MAGSTQADDENPVPVNATALIDVIFCLVIFFMCTFHFKQLDGRMKSWLPKDKGMHGGPAAPVILDDIRVVLERDAHGGIVTLLGAREVANGNELAELLAETRDDFLKLGRADVPVTIDASSAVPWRSVVDVVDVCKGLEFARIEFAGALARPR
jgi:biopolymer transport protein ExbD